MTQGLFTETAIALAKLNGLDDDTAYAAALAVGDTLEVDDAGLVMARLKDGRELRLIWPHEGA